MQKENIKEKESVATSHVEIEIINLTPHAVKMSKDGRDIISIPPSGQILRLPETYGQQRDCIYNGNNITIIDKELHVGSELPTRKEGRYYIVSLPIAQTVDRDDFLVPDDVVRDANGQPLYARRLARIVRRD